MALAATKGALGVTQGKTASRWLKSSVTAWLCLLGVIIVIITTIITTFWLFLFQGA